MFVLFNTINPLNSVKIVILRFYFLMYMSTFCVLHVYECPQRPDEGIRPAGAGARGPLEEYQMLFPCTDP